MEETKKMTKEEYLIFRYNLYMMEYMYDYIVEKILKEFYDVSDVQDRFGKKSTGRDFFYKMLNTDRTRFSKYKHDGEYQMEPTSKIKNTLNACPNLSPFIKGQKLIIQKGNIEDYPEEFNLILPDGTEASLKFAVDKAWDYVMNNKINSEELKTLSHVNGLAIWMCYRITEQYKVLKSNREKIDYKIRLELERIEKLFTIEHLDEIEFDTLKDVEKLIRKIYMDVKKIHDYKKMFEK